MKNAIKTIVAVIVFTVFAMNMQFSFNTESVASPVSVSAELETAEAYPCRIEYMGHGCNVCMPGGSAQICGECDPTSCQQY